MKETCVARRARMAGGKRGVSGEVEGMERIMFILVKVTRICCSLLKGFFVSVVCWRRD